MPSRRLSLLSHLRLLWHVPSLLNSPRGFSLQSLRSQTPPGPRDTGSSLKGSVSMLQACVYSSGPLAVA